MSCFTAKFGKLLFRKLIVEQGQIELSCLQDSMHFRKKRKYHVDIT